MLEFLAVFIYGVIGSGSYFYWAYRWTNGEPLIIDYVVTVVMAVLGPFSYLTCWLANVMIAGGEE